MIRRDDVRCTGLFSEAVLLKDPKDVVQDATQVSRLPSFQERGWLAQRPKHKTVMRYSKELIVSKAEEPA